MKRFLWLGSVLSLYLICSGCGDTFRPIIIPTPPVFPNPQAAHTVLAVSDNAALPGQPEETPGTAMVIDVSGDTEVSISNVGLAPVHAVQQSASEVLVVNHSVTGAVADSISKLNYNGTVIGNTNTISLPANSAPTFAAVAPNQTTAYVTLPNYLPPAGTGLVPSVGVVNTLTNAAGPFIQVGNNPVALAVTPDNTKLFVANELDSTISGFNTKDDSTRVSSPVATSSAPIWLVARNDNQRVYALEEGTGVLAELDTTSTAGPDTLTEYPGSYSVAGATAMVYDGNLNRLYIPGGSVTKIIDVSGTPAVVLATITMPSFPLLNLPPATATAAAVAALPDGSRAYVGSYATLPSQLTIASVSGDGTTATYAYSLTAGQVLNPGLTLTVSGTGIGFDGAMVVSAIVSGTSTCPGTCFEASNATSGSWPPAGTTGAATGAGSNIFPQVSVVNVSTNSISTTIAMPGFPDATDPSTPQFYVAACVAPTPPIPYRATFRFMMAAGGDSTRAYLSSCDGGMVNIINTATDSYILSMAAPVGTRPNPAGAQLQNLPQSPVFLIAGP